MSLSSIVGFLTALVVGVFAYLVLNRYHLRGGTHLPMWGLGLVLYFIGGLTETTLNLDGTIWPFGCGIGPAR